MPLMVCKHVDFDNTTENSFFRQVSETLKCKYESSDDWAWLIGNLCLPGLQIDALLIRERSIVIIEFKNYGGIISVCESGKWTCNDDVVIAGGSGGRNPFMQVKEYKFALIHYLNEKGVAPFTGNNNDLGQISGLVLFQQDITADLEGLGHSVKKWFHVCDFKHFDATISDIAQPRIRITHQQSMLLPNIFGIDEGRVEMFRRNPPTMAAEAELLIFLLDSSNSMNEKDTYDKERRNDHLYIIVKELLQRLHGSSKQNVYRISLIYFADDTKVFVDEYNMPYFPLDTAIRKVVHPLEAFEETSSTSISSALIKAFEVIEKFSNDEGVPNSKGFTVFLFTDGKDMHTGNEPIIKICRELSDRNIKIATVAFGFGADEELMKEIASSLSVRQKRHLDNAGVLDYVAHNKMFMAGYAGGGCITEGRVNALRNFVAILSTTK